MTSEIFTNLELMKCVKFGKVFLMRKPFLALVPTDRRNSPHAQLVHADEGGDERQNSSCDAGGESSRR